MVLAAPPEHISASLVATEFLHHALGKNRVRMPHRQGEVTLRACREMFKRKAHMGSGCHRGSGQIFYSNKQLNDTHRCPHAMHYNLNQGNCGPKRGRSVWVDHRSIGRGLAEFSNVFQVTLQQSGWSLNRYGRTWGGKEGGRGCGKEQPALGARLAC